MFLSKILLFLFFSVFAVPAKYENTTVESTTETIEQSSNSTSKFENLQQMGIENDQNTFDRIGWRRRMTDWGDLNALRVLSIVQVSYKGL